MNIIARSPEPHTPRSYSVTSRVFCVYVDTCSQIRIREILRNVKSKIFDHAGTQ